nr:uncharacterized protein LOC109186882 [Ipomoea batatas]
MIGEEQSMSLDLLKKKMGKKNPLHYDPLVNSKSHVLGEICGRSGRALRDISMERGCAKGAARTPSDFPSEELIKYGFPIGLLPTNVKGYSLNQTTGSFVLFLDDKCRITLPPDNYLATYSKKIVSPSSTGSASGLSSSGGASPESDPAATTWCSRLEWSPPNTLLRISTRALSVRASTPLLES